jgi:multiple sugar transport system permease protein
MKTWASGLLIIAMCAFAMAPVAWHAMTSLKTASESTRIPPTLFPESPTLANYEELFERRPFLRYCLNSFVIASLASVLCIAAGAAAAYPLAHATAVMRARVAAGLLVLAFFPPIAFLLPLYEMVRFAGLINHPWGLIVPYAGLNLPLAIWLLTGYFRSLPSDLREAAAMDGLSPFETFRKVILPLSMPALATVGVLVFIFSWNEFMFALTFINNDPSRTATLAVASLSGAFVYEIPWGLIAAGVIASSIPLILMVLFLQKRIVAGLTAGSAK